jgi:inner membrane protein
VDNVTHSLVGIALADLAMRGGKSERRLATGAGIISANLPDIDIVYAAISPAPLGYLLHHRGHTHTVAGLIVLAGVLSVTYLTLPAIRRWRLGDRLRLWLVIVAGLASHLLMDALNSYGVHPFYPVDVRWRFGDAVFIFEPWLWMLLGVSVAWNARSRMPRVAAVIPILIFPLLLAWANIISLEAVVSLAVGGVAFAVWTKRLFPRGRALAALTASALVIAAFVAASRSARAVATAALQPELHGALVDVVLTPNPSSPLCWIVIGIEKDEAAGKYVLWRGTLSLLPGLKAPERCASHRIAAPRRTRVIGHGALVLTDEINQSLARLRDLARSDCWVQAWLRFGRAPVVSAGGIADLRFSQIPGENFSNMAVHGGRRPSTCPTNLPEWGMPRADLLR